MQRHDTLVILLLIPPSLYHSQAVAVAPFSEHVYVSPSTDGVALQLYTISSPLTIALPLRLTATGGEAIRGEVIGSEVIGGEVIGDEVIRE